VSRDENCTKKSEKKRVRKLYTAVKEAGKSSEGRQERERGGGVNAEDDAHEWRGRGRGGGWGGGGGRRKEDKDGRNGGKGSICIVVPMRRS
jgi:hypothetical protein